LSSSTVSDRLRPTSDRRPESFSFRILSVDGGGIRGVIPALMLQRLEALLADALAVAPRETAALWHGISSPRIADCFHLIAGTSTGGLLIWRSDCQPPAAGSSLAW
jgi:patatin-like phospholipase/acyl hydrolase